MSIADWRRMVDKVDQQLLALISRRARLAARIGQAKTATSKRAFVPTREKEIYSHLRRNNRGPLSDAAIRSIFREIVSACRALEEPVRIAYLGPEATFTHVAAYSVFGHAAEYIPAGDIRSVFETAETGRAQCGVVPIENSSEGTVRETLDTFLTSELRIMSEEVLPIHLTLMGSGKLSQVKRVCSKPIALAQCRAWLSEHLPDAELVETASTSAAAAEAARRKDVAVVAHEMAAEIYGLKVIQPRIEDYERNVTRFLVIGSDRPARTGRDKTSVLCSVKHEPGALWKLLDIFRKHGLNISYLYPRPSRDKPWEYFFFLDIEGHREDEPVAAGLTEAERYCSFFKVLGSFPKAD